MVDEPEALKSQRAVLEAVLPNRNLHPRPSYVNVSWNNLATLIPSLTAAGFDPGSKTVFVAEGLLPHLDQESVETLLSDISALASPGSVFAFDFLHEDVLEGRVCPSGYPNLAMAAANKGQPFLSGMRPLYSGTNNNNSGWELSCWKDEFLSVRGSHYMFQPFLCLQPWSGCSTAITCGSTP